MWVPKITESDPRGVDCQLRVKGLCCKLVELLFSDEECRNGNATEARTLGVTLLDPHWLCAIRSSSLFTLRH